MGTLDKIQFSKHFTTIFTMIWLEIVKLDMSEKIEFEGKFLISYDKNFTSQ